jgi:murein tripeptide amidase MpaA
MLRRRVAAVAALATGLLAAAPAAATPVRALGREALSADRAVKRTCFAAPLAAGARGADVRMITAPVSGLLDARLDGSPHGADWDLAVFGPGGRLVGASAAFGGNEVVRGPVAAGDELTVQACRYAPGTAAPRLSVDIVVTDAAAPAPVVESLVRIRFRGQADIKRLVALDIDLNEVARGNRIDAVLHGPADAQRLREAGFSFTTRVADLAAYDRQALREPARGQARSGLPSGRDGYRLPEDYQQELKQLVDTHPGLIRPVILAGTSVEGRTLQGIEIAEGVDRTDDGRPVHVQMGLHHVREWPSGEVVAEFAQDLAKGYGANARITSLLQRTRTFLFPVVNPDGLEASMRAGNTTVPADDDSAATIGLAVAGTGAYRRKNCAPGPGQRAEDPCEAKDGVDLNRNYGAFWGGPGASDDSKDQTFRGPRPFSEPEAEAVHQWSSRHHVMVINSNHTFGRYVLYQPGFDEPDEPGLPSRTALPYDEQMVALGKAMAVAGGYDGDYSWRLGDITGATEDWNYFAQGAFGYTTEINVNNFHPNYQDGVIDEYLGTLEGPGNSTNSNLRPSLGLREAFLLAGETAADPANHSIVSGAAPAGRTLRLTRDFQTPTSYDEQGHATLIPEHLETALTVPASGRFEWHVNPSTRPLEILAGRTEAWTMRCESADGTTVYETRSVTVAIGQTIVEDFAGCGGAITPSSVPSGTVVPTGTPLLAPATKPARSRLQIVSVRRTGRFARDRRVAAALRATGPGPLTRVRATLVTVRGRAVATGRRTRLTSTGRVILRAGRALRARRYVLTVSARSPSGTLVRNSKVVRLSRPGSRART